MAYYAKGYEKMIFDDNIHKILKDNHTIAIVGAKDKAGAPVEHVGRYLLDNGYRILPIHPIRKTAWGIDCYKSLLDLTEVPDIVCLFRASDACFEHAQEIMRTSWRPKVFWMQSGIFSKEAGQLMSSENIIVVEDACMEREHKRLMK